MTWNIWSGEDELAFEFIDGDKHVIVSLEKTQDHVHFGYAIKRGDRFDPGAHGLEDPEAVAKEINAAVSHS